MTTARFVVDAARRPDSPPAPEGVPAPHATQDGQSTAGPATADQGGHQLPAVRIAVWQPALVVGFAGAGRGAGVTVALRQSAGGPGVLRVAALSEDAAERAVARITGLGAHLGVRLDRLNGRHRPAVLVSLPIGGSLS